MSRLSKDKGRLNFRGVSWAVTWFLLLQLLPPLFFGHVARQCPEIYELLSNFMRREWKFDKRFRTWKPSQACLIAFWRLIRSEGTRDSMAKSCWNYRKSSDKLLVLNFSDFRPNILLTGARRWATPNLSIGMKENIFHGGKGRSHHPTRRAVFRSFYSRLPGPFLSMLTRLLRSQTNSSSRAPWTHRRTPSLFINFFSTEWK